MELKNVSLIYKMPTINEPEKLAVYIQSQLKPKKKEKKENGEVFTPLFLVHEMLDNLDDAYTKDHGKNIFTEGGVKWFDPADGIGNFPIVVYQRLMAGLDMPEEARRKHILEKMIYAAELTPQNVITYKEIFCGDTYRLNIHEGDTLKLNVLATWGFDTFDVVLGNPPYNKGGIRSFTGNNLIEGQKSETLWPKFIKKAFDHLKPDGFLVFINPLSWLKKSHSLHAVLLEKHIIWMKLWDDSKSLETIHADIPISLYVLQNTINLQKKSTEIISDINRRKHTSTASEYLDPKYSIPLAFHSVFNKLMAFIESRNLHLDYKTKTVKSSGTKEMLPADYTLDDQWAVDSYTIKNGILVKKALNQHPDADKRKIIVSNKRGFTGAFIDEGTLGVTGTEKIYVMGDNLELILKIMKFNSSTICCDFMKYRMSILEREVCDYIPDLRKLGIQDITEDEFYDLIGFTRSVVQ